MIVGIDVGGTNARALLVDPATSTVIDRSNAHSSDHHATLIETLSDLVDQLRSRSRHPLTGVGLAIAGLVEPTGTEAYSPNLPGLIAAPVGADLAERVGLPVATLNDANASTWAEWHLGAGRGCNDFVMVNFGTGIGAGIVSGGRLLEGTNGFAGEVGHMVIDLDGPTHHTGQRGPWEHFSSGSTFKPEELDSFCRFAAIGIANLVMALDPQRVVIGGGLSAVGESLRSGIRRTLPEVTLGAQHRPPVEIAIVELGDDADQMATFVGDHDLLEAPVAEVVDRDLDRLVGVDRHDGAEVDAGEVDEGEPFSNDVVGQWPVEPLGEQRGPVPHDRVEAQRADEPTVGVEHDLQRCR